MKLCCFYFTLIIESSESLKARKLLATSLHMKFNIDVV